MIEPGGAIELGDDRRQLGAESPLVGAAARALDGVAPPVPPPRRDSGHRLDDQQAIAGSGAFDQAGQHLFARGIGKFVEGERGQDRSAAPSAASTGRDVALPVRRRQPRTRDRSAPPRRAPTGAMSTPTIAAAARSAEAHAAPAAPVPQPRSISVDTCGPRQAARGRSARPANGAAARRTARTPRVCLRPASAAPSTIFWRRST